MNEQEKSGWQIACEWYAEDEIERCISKAGMGLDNRDRVPFDIYSREFAVWLTNQYRLAMTKGIQFGREHGRNQLAAALEREAKLREVFEAVSSGKISVQWNPDGFWSRRIGETLLRGPCKDAVTAAIESLTAKESDGE